MLLVLLYLYGLIAIVLFIVGIVLVIMKSINNEPVKPGLKLIIISVIMVVIGFGACAVIISQL